MGLNVHLLSVAFLTWDLLSVRRGFRQIRLKYMMYYSGQYHSLSKSFVVS